MRWILVLALLGVLPVPASAQGWIEPRILPGPAPQPPRVERLRTSVTVRITDRVARVEVEEWFRNSGGGLAEGDYLYPLPGETVFSDFSLFQGEDELKGETMDAARARAVYEEIVRKHRDPALIELAGHGLLRARVFPFGPGETRNVRLRYTQVLGRAGDALRFRYVAGTVRRERPVPAVRPARAAGDTSIAFTLIADEGERFGTPFSPTHELRASRTGGRLTVRPSSELAGDVEVFLPLADQAVGVSLVAHRVNGEDGYFMLTLSPGTVRAAPAPRDVAVVVDVSGSMSGEKIEQARQALHQLLGTLNPADRFRIVSFGTRVEAQRPDWTAPTRGAIDGARAWVDRLTASGGTNISGALDEALRTPGGEGRLHVVIFITDGLPTAGETDADRIAARVEGARGDARIFAFGVGYDVHTRLLEQLAGAGNGTVDFVEPGHDVEAAVGSLAARIRHPVLVDLRFANSPVRLKDVQPSRLPDLYAGQELVVFGRYESAGAAAGELSIVGARAGRAERFAARVEFPAHTASASYIPGLWAARKVGELMRTIRIEGATPERIAEVRDLGLRFGLLTEYTSYLVQEPRPLRADGVALAAAGGPEGPPRRQAAAAAAPRPVTGANAVAAAKTAAARREARTVAAAAAAERAIVDAQAARTRPDSRVVAGRSFRVAAGVWTDVVHTAQRRLLHVEPFSAAYFEVVNRLPELTPYVSAFDAVIVAGTRLSIRIGAGGRATLTAAERDALVGDFRGR